MKQTKLLFHLNEQKQLVPNQFHQFQAMTNTIKDDEEIEGTFKTYKGAKSNKQLGFIYKVVYPHMLSCFIDAGYDILYYETFKDFQAPVKSTTDSIDYLMKKLFDKYRNDGQEFRKAKADKDSLREYIKFLDRYCIEAFGLPIPEVKQLILEA